MNPLRELWSDQHGADVAEYALAFVLLLGILLCMKVLGIHAEDVLSDAGIKLASLQ